jgi:hypothetical protein
MQIISTMMLLFLHCENQHDKVAPQCMQLLEIQDNNVQKPSSKNDHRPDGAMVARQIPVKVSPEG